MNFYLAIILYITSIVCGVILMFAVKNISRTKFSGFAFLHLVLIILFIVSTQLKKEAPGQLPVKNLFFLFVICSGIILFGLSWQSRVSIILKIYFSLFSLTLFLFLFSPSRMINFLLTARYADTLGKIIPLKENYFLEEQTSSMNGDSIPSYKLIRKHGMFHETIVRDIRFNGNLDSIHILEFIRGEHVIIRGYSNKTTFVSSEIDSVDVDVKLVKENKNQIERKL
jgi:hypothetical protein